MLMIKHMVFDLPAIYRFLVIPQIRVDNAQKTKRKKFFFNTKEIFYLQNFFIYRVAYQCIFKWFFCVVHVSCTLPYNASL